MQIVDYPADAAHVKIDESICAYTKPHEVRALLWLASKHPGAIVEIGANSGRTTSQLANHFRYRTIYAIDRLQTEGMAREQVAEVPSPSDFCAFANALPNVLPIIQDGAALRYDLLSDVGFVFIDGDHSYKGVRGDTENAVEYLRSRGGGLIAWHDAYSNPPAWCGVWQYLEELSADGLSISVFEGTWLAWAEIEPNRAHAL